MLFLDAYMHWDLQNILLSFLQFPIQSCLWVLSFKACAHSLPLHPAKCCSKHPRCSFSHFKRMRKHATAKRGYSRQRKRRAKHLKEGPTYSSWHPESLDVLGLICLVKAHVNIFMGSFAIYEILFWDVPDEHSAAFCLYITR